MDYLKAFKLFESSTKWYHGTDSKFKEFSDSDGNGSRSMGIWSTDDEAFAEMFGEYVLEVELDYKNPYIITAEKWNDIRDAHATDTTYFLRWKDELIKKGYDALFIKENSWTSSGGIEFKDPNIVAVFSPDQIRIFKNGKKNK